LIISSKTNNQGWTQQGAKDFIAEVERLKSLWWTPDLPEPTTRQALANLSEVYERTDGFAATIRENEERAALNERLRKERIRKIKAENKNLEWPKPKPDDSHIARKSEDYWKPNGCMYCGYRPMTTHDYEVHIVTKHPGKPGYPVLACWGE
jgi:hypothetical protein